MIKKITEFVLMNFVQLEEKESEVRIGKTTVHPVISFKEVEVMVVFLASKGKYYEIPDNEQVLMYSRDSQMTRLERVRFSASIRSEYAKEKIQQAIHAVTEGLIEMQELIKVTTPRIENTKLIATNKGPVSVRTIRKYMMDRTKRVIDEHNEWAPFKSEITAEKFAEYLTLDAHISLEEVSERLKISKRTASEFRNLYQEREF